MNTKHTSGPWRCHESDLHADFHHIEQIDINGKRVTDIAYLTLHKGEEGRANARLIASAPELLGANLAEEMARKYDADPGSKEANDALRVLEQLGYGEDCPLTPSEFASQLRRAAIAKATGAA
jgi:hypothetical protein